MMFSSRGRFQIASPLSLFVRLGAGVALLAGNAFGQAPSTRALKRLSLEELLDTEVISVSRRPERLLETASGIRVITAEDIRRSGVASLPQALRLASNLQTSQFSSSHWAIGARGFNTSNSTSNKLLVMIDGRSVYTPLFSGVFWDAQDTFLPDIDRIEVISGPGGATWGANAVNGVINILTRDARDTQGTVLYGGAGTEERAFGGMRHGGAIAGGHYRVYVKHFDIDGSARRDRTDTRDRWVLTQAGFRTDWHAQAGAHLTLQGDAYTGWVAQPTAARGLLRGGNVLARWSRTLAPDADVQVQAYFDTARRDAPNTFGDRLDTFDLDAQHTFALGSRQKIIWGVAGRIANDHVRNLPTQAFMPADFTTRLVSAFMQDEIEIAPDRLRLTLGAKIENNNYSGSDFQPSLRLAWLANTEHTLWSAVSRAVRTPSRIDRDLYTPANPPFLVAGGPNFDSEVLIAYEIGWRGRLGRKTSAATTVFVHDYDDLRTLELPVPLTFKNGLQGRTYGVEFSADHALFPWWRWNAGYTLLRKDLSHKPGSLDINQGRAEISDPRYQAQVRTSINLRANAELDLAWRYVDDVPTILGGVLNNVAGYQELDARIAWRAREDLEFALIGRNLLDRQHPELGAVNVRREIERSVSGKVTWRY